MPDKDDEARAKLAATPLPASPYLQVTEDRIFIRSGYSEQLLRILRWIPKLEWRPESRSWSIPIASAEILRAILPEVLRLAEATQEPDTRQTTAEEPSSNEELFKASARLLFGSDWQRETARALDRDETSLARFLLGERSLEDGDRLYADMLALMRRRATEIAAAAEHFAAALGLAQIGLAQIGLAHAGPEQQLREEPPGSGTGQDQGI